MSLFTDGPISKISELTSYDSAVLEVATAESIDLAAKMGLAQDEIGAELLIYLLEQANRDSQCYTWGTLRPSQRRIRGLSDVVVTDPLRRWHGMKSIALIYQDAYFGQLNDRYQAKWKQYVDAAKGASEQVYRIGVGLVLNPVPMPAEPLLLSSEGSLSAATYYVRMTWVDAAGQEGSPSNIVSLTTVDGNSLVVIPTPAPSVATGWNVYVGDTPEKVWIQNTSPLLVGAQWTMPAWGVKVTKPAGYGQKPDRYVVNRQVIPRG